MNKAIFKGIYTSNPDVSADSYPVANNNGYWRAWNIPSDMAYVVQMLDAERKPSGSLYPLAPEDFTALFIPLANRQIISADMPDLLSLWLERAIEEGDEGVTGALLDTTRRAKVQAGVPATLLNFCVQGTSEYADGFIEEDIESVTGEDVVILQSLTAVAKANSLEAAASGVGEIDCSGCLEEKNSTGSLPPPLCLRDKMANQLASVPPPAQSKVTEALAMLLNVENSQEWNDSAYLTRLGLALRRENLFELALLCHQQALYCTPDDARILFNIGRTEFDLRWYAEAATHLQKVVDRQPDFAVAAQLLALVLTKKDLSA